LFGFERDLPKGRLATSIFTDGVIELDHVTLVATDHGTKATGRGEQAAKQSEEKRPAAAGILPATNLRKFSEAAATAAAAGEWREKRRQNSAWLQRIWRTSADYCKTRQNLTRQAN